MFVICNLHWIAVMPKEEPYIIPKRYAEIGGPRYVDRNLELDGQHYVDREVLETIELVAINDAYELSGRGFFGSFIIDTDVITDAIIAMSITLSNQPNSPQ